MGLRMEFVGKKDARRAIRVNRWPKRDLVPLSQTLVLVEDEARRANPQTKHSIIVRDRRLDRVMKNVSRRISAVYDIPGAKVWVHNFQKKGGSTEIRTLHECLMKSGTLKKCFTADDGESIRERGERAYRDAFGEKRFVLLFGSTKVDPDGSEGDFLVAYLFYSKVKGEEPKVVLGWWKSCECVNEKYFTLIHNR